MRWTLDGTIRNALWIGGGQWAGKTTVAGLLTDRYGLVHYPYDYHDPNWSPRSPTRAGWSC